MAPLDGTDTDRANACLTSVFSFDFMVLDF